MAFSSNFRVASAVLISCVAMVHAQGLILPSNSTIQNASQYKLVTSNTEYNLPIMGILNAPAQEDSGRAITTGLLYRATASHYLDISANSIVTISCDERDYPGNLNAGTMFEEAVQSSAGAIVLTSVTSSHCLPPSNFTGYANAVYSTVSVWDAAAFNEYTYQTNKVNAGIYARSTSTNPTNGNSNSGNNPLGPSPSTNVAMIILYAITGLITLLFMSIIVTGAIRAHRHPERYGLRGGPGRSRQSRVRGVGKAILDSLPIVKFGEREDRTKPTDIEMASGAHGSVEVVAPEGGQTADRPDAAAVAGARTESPKSPPPQSNEINEVAAPNASDSSSNQGCSICTDDFEVGQDQRVLPCDHRFHPGCIDPWLLNVSGTCPLCRIDLRPSSASIAGSDDERQEGGHLAPPLEGADGARTIGRRSTLLSLIGNNRVSSMTREQRLVALREHRRRAADEAADVEEESSVRRRLRKAFRIRTRHIGEDDESRADAASGPAASTAALPASGSTDERSH